MKERTKETLRDGFGSLISNAAAMRGAKNGPLWLTILMFVFSLLFPILPLFVSQMNTNGSTFLKSYSYGLERYVTKMAIDLDERHVEFGIDENHLLSIKENGNSIAYSNYGGTTPFAAYTNEVSGQYELALYVSDAKTTAQRKEVNTEITTRVYGNGTTTVSADTENIYRPSYILLFDDAIYVVIYNNNKQITNSLGGDFKTMKANANYLTVLLEVKDKDGNIITKSMTDDNYVNGVYKNFKKFLDKSYETLKIKDTLLTCGIYLAIFFGVSVLMGFLMWLLTRGKKNPNNYFSPWLTMKIEARLGLAPGIITLIAGFFLTQYVPLIFIMTLGLRVMWISMKELRPIQQ